jgi:hypothetical protein
MCNRLRPDGRSGLKGNQRRCDEFSDTWLNQRNEKETTAIRKAIHSGLADLEDAVQHEIALLHHCDTIITRKLKDFNKSKIPAMTASQYLKTL